MAQFKLKGDVAVRGDSLDGDDIISHEEVVTAEDETEAIELSLSGFTEKQEPVWEKGFTVERVLRFSFQASEIVMGMACPLHIESFVGTFAEMEAYVAEKTKGATLYDGVVYTQSEP